MKKKILLGILFFTLFLTACSSKEDNASKSVDNNQVENSELNTNENSEQDNNKTDNNSSADKKSEVNNNKDSKKDKTTENIDSNSTENATTNNKDSKQKNTADNNKKDTSTVNSNITEKVKDYIMNGQENKSEADKIKWSQTFLNQVDINSLYKQFISKGGSPNDLEQFAKYITSNAPILKNWKDLFEKDLYNKYQEKVIRLEHLEGDLYQAYVKKDGKEVPYVVVSSRTGYFHG